MISKDSNTFPPTYVWKILLWSDETTVNSKSMSGEACEHYCVLFIIKRTYLQWVIVVAASCLGTIFFTVKFVLDKKKAKMKNVWKSLQKTYEISTIVHF